MKCCRSNKYIQQLAGMQGDNGGKVESLRYSQTLSKTKEEVLVLLSTNGSLLMLVKFVFQIEGNKPCRSG